MTGYEQFLANEYTIRRSDWTGENYVVLRADAGNLNLKCDQVIDGVTYSGINVLDLDLDAEGWVIYTP